MDVQRIVFGWFPTYRRGAPLPPRFDRVLSVGDASAVQQHAQNTLLCSKRPGLPAGLPALVSLPWPPGADSCAAPAALAKPE